METADTQACRVVRKHVAIRGSFECIAMLPRSTWRYTVLAQSSKHGMQIVDPKTDNIGVGNAFVT